MKFYAISLSLILLFGMSTVHAQRLCEALVDNALEDAEANCVEQDGEIFCYAHNNLTSTFFAEDLVVSTLPGSIIGIDDVQTIQGTDVDLEEDEWGIAYLQVRASLEEATADSSVRIIMLGDVFLENGQDDESDDAVTTLESLYFTTGGESDCQEAPNTLIVQGPAEEEVDIIINDVPIRIGSTIALGLNSTNDTGQMWITVIAGEAILYPELEKERYLPEGYFTEVEVSPADDYSADPIIDPVSGEPILAADGTLQTRRVPVGDFIEPIELSEDAESYRSPVYYDTIRQLPETLLNYPLNVYE